MAKTRLNTQHRELLYGLATKKVAERMKGRKVFKDWVEADRKFFEALKAHNDKIFPKADSVVLKKYSLVKRVTGDLWYQDDAGRASCYPINPPQLAFTSQRWVDVPYNSSSKDFTFDKNLTTLVTKAHDARSKMLEAQKEYLRDYKSLIYCSKNFEDVEEVWKEAADLAETIKAGRALVPVVVNRIKQECAA